MVDIRTLIKEASAILTDEVEDRNASGRVNRMKRVRDLVDNIILEAEIDEEMMK
jgi:hypothetical protein